MPTYDQLLMSNPGGYEQSASALGGVATEIEQSTTGYQQTFTRGASGPSWSGQAQQAASGYVQRSVEYGQRMAKATVEAGSTLQGFAAELAAIVAQLRTISTTATAQGFLINEGVVIIGPAQWAEITAANVASEAVYAAYQAQATALTSEIFAVVGEANAADLAAAQRLAQAAFQLGAELTDLPYGPAGPLDPATRSALQAMVRDIRDRFTRLGRTIQQRRVVGAAQYDINGQRGSLEAVSGRQTVDGQNAYPGTLDEIPAGQRRYNPSVPPDVGRGADAENKIFETLNQRFPQNATGRIYLYSEKEPCPACRQVIAQFQAEHPGIKIFYGWG
jgi:The  BURPS668_1122 family of deaminases